MKKNIFFLLALMLFVFFSSCEEKGSTALSLSNVKVPVTAHFGDSIPFSVVTTGKEALSSITAKVYYRETKVSEQLMLVNNTGTYSGKLYMPYVADYVDGSASIKFSVKNRVFEFYDLPEASVVQLAYPDFPYLTLSTNFGEFRMERVNSTNEYKATGAFKEITMAKILSPAVGEWGNPLWFGYANKTTTVNAKPEYAGLMLDSIEYQGAIGVASDIFMDIVALKARPVPVTRTISFEDTGNQTVVINKNDKLIVSGLSEFNTWWINPSFFTKGTDNSLKFEALGGTYKITADKEKKYLIVEPWDTEADQPLAFNPSTGEGAIWVNGSGSIGIPGTSNAPGWNLAKSFAMAPLGNKKYELQLKVGTNINATLSRFKLYGQYNSDSYIFTEESPARIVINDPGTLNLFYFEDPDKEDSNGSGNGMVRGRTLPAGKTIVITVDASTIPVVLSYEVK